MDRHVDANGADPAALPAYLQTIFLDQLDGDEDDVRSWLSSSSRPSLDEIKKLPSRRHQYGCLLLARHRLTQRLAEIDGPSPELILQRAAVYEALGYHELALADAYVSYTLCEVAFEGPDISDLEPVGLDGEHWPADLDDDSPVAASDIASAHQYRSLILLCRSALILGCQHQAKVWIDVLLELNNPSQGSHNDHGVLSDAVVNDFCDFFTIYGEDGSFRQSVSDLRRNHPMTLFGRSQRHVYPWNEHEPDRMSKAALAEINGRLHESAPDLEVEISVLPNLTSSVAKGAAATNGGGADVSASSSPAEGCSQLGLYAKRDLPPGATILEERSVLTAIRPHGEALCDACAADMEAIPHDERRYCGGCNLPFCSEACHSAASQAYHRANLGSGEDKNDETDDDDDYPPAATPFCPGSNGNEDIHTLGRAESSSTPEWDLYFLLLSRTMQMAETQETNPLDLFEIKYLWGGFSPTPSVGSLPRLSGPKTLPYSVRHHVELPLQWFEVLMHSRPECRPYSAHWLQNYDWWVVQTLFAKFRGVADAQQSTWTGKPEVAAVHPLWCLANHSCNPNVTWNPSGVRNLTVVTERVWQRPVDEEKSTTSTAPTAWTGIKAGDEIWNHYTDVQEKDVGERRARLQGVLGGDCRCERCVWEASQQDR
jgi:hypothetical protein